MRLRTWRVAVGISAILASSVFITPSVALAGGPVFPDYPSGDCATTLQACITGAAAGEVITIVTNGPITEDLTITNSLTLRAGHGFHPVIDGDIDIVRHDGTIQVTIRDLKVHGQVAATLNGGTGHIVRLRGLKVTEATRDAIHLGSTVPTTFEVTDSQVHTNGSEALGVDGLSVETDHSSGTSTILLMGNRVDGTGNPNSGNGIFLGFENFGTGFTDAHIYNNRILDVARCPGCEGSVVAALWVNTEFAATSDVDVVGNTFDGSGVDGVILRALLDDAGGVGFTTMHVYDNVVSHAAHAGLRATTDPARMTLDADFNDFFANADGNVNESGETLGSHDLALNPKYMDVAAGDLRLKASSPLIDAGLVCTPGELGYVDAAGGRRLAGANVDMGAFERDAGSPTGEAWFGTSGNDSHTGTAGADILCGLGGKDFLDASGGNDYVDGGSGADISFGGPGSDRMLGRSGNDLLCAKDGTHGNDAIDGGAGTDKYRADPGDAIFGVEQLGNCQTQ
jgi:RTX calcium-binding nonapeptide repeat (4 copies)